jgi:hypothetical protein
VPPNDDSARSRSDRNLVLSFSTAAEENNIRRFVESIRRFCPSATTDIVLFVEPEELPFSQFCAEQGVTLVPVRTYWREVSASLPLKAIYRGLMRFLRQTAGPGSKVDRGLAQPWLHPIGGRHLYYEDFLRSNAGLGRVMLSDSRDVVFQDDPFARLDALDPDSMLLHAAEQEPHLIYSGNPEDNVDVRWVHEVYGPDVAEKLRGKQTLCAGTTFGSRRLVLDYLARMCDEMLRNRTTPLDQAMHNKVLRLDWPEDKLQTHSNRDGFILTMFGIERESYDLRDNGDVFVGGHKPAVLHQWDHIQPVRKAVLERYPNRQD